MVLELDGKLVIALVTELVGPELVLGLVLVLVIVLVTVLMLRPVLVSVAV